MNIGKLGIFFSIQKFSLEPGFVDFPIMKLVLCRAVLRLEEQYFGF